MDNCYVGYHINNDEELGKFAAEGDFIKELENLPEEVWAFIDFKKVGEQMRKAEKGVFIGGCFVACDIEHMEEVYDGVTLPQNSFESDGIFSLLIAKEPKGDETALEQAQWLYLPATDKQLSVFIENLDAASFEECVYYELRTAIPQLKDLFHDLSQLKQLNDLAKCLSNQELRKCKAVLEAVECESIEQVIDYCENLHCFDYYPDLVHATDYGEYLCNSTEAIPKSLSPHINFESYGLNQMEEQGIKETQYGFVIKNEQSIAFQYRETLESELDSLKM